MNDCRMYTLKVTDFHRDLERQAYENKIPLYGVFELTARCNFNCKMCYVHLSEDQVAKIGRELTNEEWLEIARQARDAGMLYLTLTGGEVFNRPGFKELYIELTKMGFLIQILSNGYMIDEKVMEWLKEYPPYSIRFTLYGTSNEVYEKVCGVKNGFDRVEHAINLILEAMIPFYMTATIVKENFEELDSMYEFARRKRVFFRHASALVKAVRGATSDAEKHRIEEFSIVKEFEIKKLERFTPKVNSYLDYCGSYRKSFCITWDGKMTLCTFMDHPYVSMLENDFEKAWNELLDKLEKLKEPQKCHDCKYEGFCQRCPGLFCAECGSAEEVAEKFCEKAKKLYRLYSYKEE